MMNGCRRDICINVLCKNNPNFKYKGLSEESLRVEIERLCRDFKEAEGAQRRTELCCHTDFMQGLARTVQGEKNNMHEITRLDFLMEFL